MAAKKTSGMSRQEAGRRGERAAMEEYESDFYEEIGRKSSCAIGAKYGFNSFRKLGHRGGERILEE